MTYFVYILQSSINGSFYKGSTNDLNRRFKEHNNKEEKATSSFAPWSLVWKTSKPTKSEAYQLEMKLKNLSIKRTIEFIQKYPVENTIGGPDVTLVRHVRMLTFIVSIRFRPSPQQKEKV